MTEQPRAANGEYGPTHHADTGLQLDRPFANHSPLEVDTLLSDLYSADAKVAQALSRKIDSAHYKLGHRKEYIGGRRTGTWRMPPAETIAALQQALADGKVVSYEVKNAERLFDEIDDLQAEKDDIGGQMTELNDEFRRRPWTRFFLVTSSAGGHIHSSMSCHTCRFDTEFGWLPSLSGKDEPAAVADQGAILCTACYPSAPLGWTSGKTADPDTCPGSNKASGSEPRMWGRTRYGTCSVCAGDFPASYSAGIRKHKTPKAAKK